MTVNEALENLRANPEDRDAWEVIAVDAYESLLVYVASLLLTFRISPGEAAHDIVHDVLLTFYERWPRSRANITSVSALHAYLRTSCRNLLIDRYRHYHSARQMVDFLTLKFTNAFVDESGLYSSIFLNEIFRMLHPNCASLLRQYVTEDLTPAEIAERMGISPSAFYSRWHRCIEQVRKIIVRNKTGLTRS